jgi:hypothetical protein
VLIFSNYFSNIIALSDVPIEVAKIAAAGLLFKAVVFITIVEIVFQGMLAISNHKAAQLSADEREKSFESKGNMFGYTVLVIGVMLTLGHILMEEYNIGYAAQNSTSEIPLLTAHILMFSFILSEVVRFSGQLYYFRRGQ